LIIVCVATFCLRLMTSSETRAEHLAVKIYTTADGLAHERVRRVVRDSHGFLWFCTVDGLSRFDGYRFTSYRKEDGLPVSEINDVCETPQGVYWIATFQILEKKGFQVTLVNPRQIKNVSGRK